MLTLAAFTVGTAPASVKTDFDKQWKFMLGDESTASEPGFNDSDWRTLTLPHDWSIEHQVDQNAPAGNDGGYFPTGIGWYRKTFDIPVEYRGEKIFLYFEGVYMNSTVYVNGQVVGGHPYGYTSFFCDITSAVTTGKENVVAVRVDNAQQKNSRWYSGSGIYRHVSLIHCNTAHIDNWGATINTLSISPEKAVIELSVTIKNEGTAPRCLSLATVIGDIKDSSDKVTIPAYGEQNVTRRIEIPSPQLWELDSPHLYTAQLSLMEGDDTVDTHMQNFGIREMRFTTEGFFLNGKNILINGGCIHHDNGILGAAAFDRAEERKVLLMKAGGFNAIRTSHNLPSEAFLDACDRLGMLVIDEAFDGWRDAKNQHDYSEIFDRYWQEDVRGMVLRDRRHPSIMAWSIGNEVIERKKLEVVTTARKLAAEIHKLDARPVTSALAAWDSDWEIYDPLAAELDITGYNYLMHYTEDDHKRVPSRIMWQTESYPKDAFQNWEKVHDNGYIVGDFVWTGIDYLGEAGIGRYWYTGEPDGEHYSIGLYPCHAAYCGDIDLTGWRKPISHYRSMLYNDTEKLYMAVKEPDGYYGQIHTGLWAVWPTWECWNWPGHEGKEIEVELCSRYPKVRLYLNDRLVGTKEVSRSTEMKAVFKLSYQAGTLRAEGIAADGTVAETRILATASEPAAIRTTVENRQMQANGEDLSFIQVEVVDAKGRVCPQAELPLQIKISGEGTLAGAGNANIKEMTPYNSTDITTWKGRALVVVRSTHNAGKAKASITSKGIKSANEVIVAK